MAAPADGAADAAEPGAPARSSSGAGGADGGLEHAASTPKIAAAKATTLASLGTSHMWVILLEAFGAGALLVLIVWWTMFAGRKRGERDEGR